MIAATLPLKISIVVLRGEDWDIRVADIYASDPLRRLNEGFLWVITEITDTHVTLTADVVGTQRALEDYARATYEGREAPLWPIRERRQGIGWAGVLEYQQRDRRDATVRGSGQVAIPNGLATWSLGIKETSAFLHIDGLGSKTFTFEEDTFRVFPWKAVEDWIYQTAHALVVIPSRFERDFG